MRLLPLLTAAAIALGLATAASGQVNYLYPGALAAPKVLCQSAVRVPITGDTAEHTVYTCNVPGKLLGANGQVVVDGVLTVTANTNVKTFRYKVSGTTVWTNTASSAGTNSTDLTLVVGNRNATNSQIATTNSNNALTTTSVDTTATVPITLTVQAAVGTDTIALERILVVAYPRP